MRHQGKASGLGFEESWGGAGLAAKGSAGRPQGERSHVGVRQHSREGAQVPIKPNPVRKAPQNWCPTGAGQVGLRYEDSDLLWKDQCSLVLVPTGWVTCFDSVISMIS